MKVLNCDITFNSIMSVFNHASSLFIREANEHRHQSQFKALFGTTSTVCQIIWSLIKDNGNLPANAREIHLLFALHFLKCYQTEEINSITAGVREKTFRKWCKAFIPLIASLEVICFEYRKRTRPFPLPGEDSNVYTSLDATDCRIQEPTPFSRRFFSWKFNGPGLKYEIALNIRNGHIVWVNGGVPCGDCNDLSLARRDFISKLDPNEKVIADRIYQHPCFIIPTPDQDRRSLELQKGIRARHETVNARLKRFNVLQHEFRHDLSFHVECFFAVANIVQLNIENGEPLFQI